MVDDFFTMLGLAVAPPGATGAAGGTMKEEGAEGEGGSDGEGGMQVDEEKGDGGDARAVVDAGRVRFCERFVELCIDLLSQLPTRRFVHALLEDRAFLVRCKRSALYGHEEGQLFMQLTDLLQFYLAFDINDHTGELRGGVGHPGGGPLW